MRNLLFNNPKRSIFVDPTSRLLVRLIVHGDVSVTVSSVIIIISGRRWLWIEPNSFVAVGRDNGHFVGEIECKMSVDEDEDVRYGF